VCTAATMAAIVMTAASAAAQAPAAGQKWFISAEAGVEAVQNVGGLGGVQLGRRLSSRLDVFGEAVYLQDIVTRRRNESANSVASYLAQTQGKPASGSLTVPTWTFQGGIRYFLTGPRGIRPFVVASAGGARATMQPKFTLAGADVTTTMPQYGVTLGSDLTGTTTKAVYGGGFGITTNVGAWALDAGVRIFSVQLDGQAANATSLIVGFGRKF